MFDIKVVDKRENKVDVDIQNADAVIYIASTNEGTKSAMLFDCNGQTIAIMFTALKQLTENIRKRYEEIDILDKLGLIDRMLQKMNDNCVTTKVEEDDTPVIEFPRKRDEER